MASKKTITSVNAIFALSITDLFDSPTQLQGFAADDIFSTDAIVLAETVMGLDGKLSGGYVHQIVKQKIHLQADSPSVAIFELWAATSQANQDVFFGQATVNLPGTQKSYTLRNGILKSAKLLPDAKKTLSAHEFEIDWESVSINPTA
jgi:hypothetical protein